MCCVSGPTTRGSSSAGRTRFALERAGNFAGCPHDYADTAGKDHGRIEIRRCRVTGDSALLTYVDPDRA